MTDYRLKITVDRSSSNGVLERWSNGKPRLNLFAILSIIADTAWIFVEKKSASIYQTVKSLIPQPS